MTSIKTPTLPPGITIDDIKKSVPRRFRSFQETKTDRLARAQGGQTDDNHAPTQATLGEMEAFTTAALEKAKAAVNGDVYLLALVEHMEATWAESRDSFLRLTVELGSFHYRTDDEIRLLLTRFGSELNAAVHPDWHNSEPAGSA